MPFSALPKALSLNDLISLFLSDSLFLSTYQLGHQLCLHQQCQHSSPNHLHLLRLHLSRHCQRQRLLLLLRQEHSPHRDQWKHNLQQSRSRNVQGDAIKVPSRPSDARLLHIHRLSELCDWKRGCRKRQAWVLPLRSALHWHCLLSQGNN